MHLLLVLAGLELCLVGRCGELVSSHHVLGPQVLGGHSVPSGLAPLSTVGRLHLRTAALRPTFGLRKVLPPPCTSARSVFHLMVCQLGRKGAAGSWGGPVFQVRSSRRALGLLIGVKWGHQIFISSLMESEDLGEFSSPALCCWQKPRWPP